MQKSGLDGLSHLHTLCNTLGCLKVQSHSNGQPLAGCLALTQIARQVGRLPIRQVATLRGKHAHSVISYGEETLLKCTHWCVCGVCARACQCVYVNVCMASVCECMCVVIRSD